MPLWLIAILLTLSHVNLRCAPDTIGSIISMADAGGDVVAMAKRHAPTGGASAHARVAAQWTYDAYGAVVAAEVFDAASPVNRCGHKGLFADRLDVGVPRRAPA
jgi:hypothetical protein